MNRNRKTASLMIQNRIANSRRKNLKQSTTIIKSDEDKSFNKSVILDEDLSEKDLNDIVEKEGQVKEYIEEVIDKDLKIQN